VIVKSVLIWAGIIAASLSNISIAATDSHTGYVLNSSGGIIILNGLCIHTGEWTPEMAIPECDPEVVAANKLKQTSQPSSPTHPVAAQPIKSESPQ